MYLFVSKVAGGNGAGSALDRLYYPWGIYVDSNQAVFIVDRYNHRVVRWDNGFISGVTVAGSTSDAGPWSYQFNYPTGIDFDPFGYMYILDSGNSRIQRWLPGATYGTTVIAGSFSTPYGLQFDNLGNLVVTDTLNYRVATYALTCRKYFTPSLFSKIGRTNERFPLCSTIHNHHDRPTK